MRLCSLALLGALAGCSAPLPPIGAPKQLAQSKYGDTTLAVAPPASTDGSERAGPRSAPSSLAFSRGALAVIDSVHARLLELPLDGGVPTLLDADDFYGAAPDVVVTSDGALWALGPADCGCVRRIDGAHATGVEVPIPLELDPGRLIPDGARLLIAGTDGAHLVFDGAPLDLESIRDRVAPAPHSGSAALSVALAGDDPRALVVTGTSDAGARRFQTRADALGDVSRVELLAPACADSTIVVATVVADGGGAADAMLRFDARGNLVARAFAPRLPSEHANFEVFRRFAVAPDGRLFQLRITEDGYALLSWPSGC